MKCPNCKLENSDNAIRCDCGYDFKAKSAKESDSQQKRKEGKKKKRKTNAMAACFLFIIAAVCAWIAWNTYQSKFTTNLHGVTTSIETNIKLMKTLQAAGYDLTSQSIKEFEDQKATLDMKLYCFSGLAIFFVIAGIIFMVIPQNSKRQKNI